MQKEIISLVYIMCIKHWGERKCNTKNDDALHTPSSCELVQYCIMRGERL